MKKIMYGALLTVFAVSLLLAPTAVFAGPPSIPNYGTVDPVKISDLPPAWMYDVEKVIPAFKAPGGQLHIVTDELAPTPSGGSASGTTVFWCQSTVGFQFNIVTLGLTPLARYSVIGVGIQVTIVPAGTNGAVELEPGLWIDPSSIAPIALDLGSYQTDAKGLGGVKGTTKLPAGKAYDLVIKVFNANPTEVLETAYENGTQDTTGFIVY